MLRITVISETREETVLRVEGWVSGRNVALLDQEGARWLREGVHLVLDLDGVRFIDRAGMALLQQWGTGGVALRGGSPFVRSLLTKHGLN